MPPHLEIPIFGPASAAAAVAAGARRLELNREGSYAIGGTTPTLTELSSLRAILDAANLQYSVPIRIMIRPRGPLPSSSSSSPLSSPEISEQQQQDFIYTPKELNDMASCIDGFRSSGLLDTEKGDGFVFGVLATLGLGGVVVDLEANALLIQQAGPFPCVFHRAFDEVISPSGETSWRQGQAQGQSQGQGQLESLVACGFSGVLTSGGRGNVCDGENVVRLKEIVHASEGRMEIVVGGGVRRGNVRDIVEGMGTEGWREQRVWFHSSCLVGGRFDEEEAGGLVRQLNSFG